MSEVLVFAVVALAVIGISGIVLLFLTVDDHHEGAHWLLLKNFAFWLTALAALVLAAWQYAEIFGGLFGR